MVKLCIITTIPATVRAFMGEQLRYLQQNGFDITIITAYDEIFAKSLPEGVKYKPVLMTRIVQPWQDIRAFFEILLILRQGKFDIIQYATPKAALLGSLASRYAKVPVRLYLMWGLYYVTQIGFKKFVFKTIEKIVCNCSTAIAPDSEGNRRFAVEEGLCKKDKIEVVGHGSANGVNTSRFDPSKLKKYAKDTRRELGIPEDAYVFGSIAALVRDKGVNEMVAAFVEVARKYSNAHLLIIGQTAEKNTVSKETLDLIRRHEHIIHIGRQKEPEKYLAAMDAFVLPTYREGFGVVNIEASAMELPVISTNVPGPKESIIDGETGLLVPARAVAPIVEAMKRLLGNRDLGKRLGVAGRQRVLKCYEQKQLWQAIVEHRRRLLMQSGRFEEVEGELKRV
ncbi:MAG: glycosyltransferase family 4 protein [Sedimentisphaerales bacterium]|jgi:glycosyltransferase involved in cell wall biosynthesis